jgi:hypothetical protein
VRGTGSALPAFIHSNPIVGGFLCVIAAAASPDTVFPFLLNSSEQGSPTINDVSDPAAAPVS